MRPALKIGMVAGGYAGAFLIASAVVAIRVAGTSGPDAQASSGMYAFGDAFLFIAVFGLLALLPTAAALYFLRPSRRFWVVLSVLALGAAFTGAVAAILFAALLSPHRTQRFTLLAATAVELAVVAYAGLVWFLPLVFHKG